MSAGSISRPPTVVRPVHARQRWNPGRLLTTALAAVRRRAASGVHRATWWGRRQLLTWTGRRRFASWLAVGATLVALPLLVLFVSSIVTLAGVRPFWVEEFDTRCEGHSFACNSTTEILALVFAVPAGFLLFLTFRMSRVKGRYITGIRRHPDALFPSWSSKREVVGRDALCDLIDADFSLTGVRERSRCSRARRPRVIVGDIGSGKTAVLVRLAQVLSERGAVPVPVRLRSAYEELDFLGLARAEFLRRTQSYVLTEDEGDRIWRLLCEGGSIVVLADGLEEALLGSRARDTRLRLAFEEAERRRVPVVISARPEPNHATLHAALIRLEGVPEEAAVDVLAPHLEDAERGEVEKLVERAGVSGMPFALHLLQELADRGALGDLIRSDLDGVRLRSALLERWFASLPERSLAWSRLPAEQRDRALLIIEALALVGLQQDRLELRFEQLQDSPWRSSLLDTSDPNYEAASMLAADLDLVDPTQHGIRFTHNLVQAYLGSRALSRVLDEPFLESVTVEPGRELLMAIVLACAADPDGPAAERARDWLVAAAESRPDAARLSMLAAATEIQSLRGGPDSTRVAQAVADAWPAEQRRDERRHEAKLRCLRRMTRLGSESGFTALWEVCQRERDPGLRFAAAQRIAAAGAPAYAALAGQFELGDRLAGELYGDRHGRAARPDDVRHLSVQGWIAPLLAQTCHGDARDELVAMVERWARLPGDIHPVAECSLAQGLRWQANQRASPPELRDRLAGAGGAMLSGTTHWWSQIALLQALTLWQLSGVGGRLLRVKRTVSQWLDPVRGRRHPFVEATSDLCCRALRWNDPRPWIWVDESAAVRRIGSASRQPATQLWIAEPSGWTNLNPRAQQLLADVVLLVNLIERCDGSARDARLEATRERLPACLTDGSRRMQLVTEQPRAAVRCCELGLCSSRHDDSVPVLGDISESFARSQLRLLKRRGRQRAPRPGWQHGPRQDYYDAWVVAERRARE